VGMGVRDEGSQAGVNEGDQSGRGVALPEVEGAPPECWGISSWLVVSL
jgi:hypothetical protein